MPHSRKPIHDQMGLHSLAHQFQDSFNLEQNKPDFKELNLGSLLLTTNGSGGVTTSISSATYHTPLAKRSDGNATSTTHSTELEAFPPTPTSENHRSITSTRNSKPGHRRSNSTGAPLVYSGYSNHNTSSASTSTSSSTTNGSGGGGTSCGSGGASSISSPNTTIMYPTGNICPSGKILKSNMGHRSSNRTDKLGSGIANYGHGSIIKGVGNNGGKFETNVVGNVQLGGALAVVKRVMLSSDPEEVKMAGNELYRKRHFVEASSLYDRAIALSPENAAYRSNMAASLTMLGRLGEAVRECEEAVRLDPGYGRAHQRLASLYLRLGQVENARHHLYLDGQQADSAELQILFSLEKHLSRCKDARKIGDWRKALMECDAAMVTGADSSPHIVACKAEACLKLQQLEDADSIMSDIPKIDPYPTSCSQMKFFGMLSEAYVLFVRAQVDMAFGRFENAVSAIEKAGLIDYSNIEAAMLLNNVKLVTRARDHGRNLFNSGRFSEACLAYGEGLKYDLCNSVLYCNRAVCWSKLALWEQSVEDCNQALKIQPNYTKALLRRAVSNAKLERWAEAVRDYEILRRELPGDKEVSKSLSHARAALNKSHEDVNNVKSGEVEEISSLDQLKAAISSATVSVVHFKVAFNQQCELISPFVDSLCVQYPSINFLKVDVDASPEVAKAESIKIVPTFNIYKNGDKVKEIICPTHQGLESLVRQYSL
ncbi:unnamed protein product [Ilex paraguariensis]|uniref:Thioredoxin domain-containing protein n=1 Tax=Ilex paraguariensis TaxID=185542 RepID=A0ABC8QKU8_9AQUA